MPRGFNLTIPHKVEVLKYLDELSPAAEIIGAVNMVVNRDGKLWGENTDGKGFLLSLAEEGISPEGKTVMILGAGGAARALAVESALAKAEKVISVNRTMETGEALTGLVSEKTGVETQFIAWDGRVAVPPEVDILINGTSIGLYPHTDQKPEIAYDTIRPDMAVSDVIFNDPNSLFLQEARKQGAKTVNGLGMLVNQGALNFKLWTGVDAPVDVMIDVLRREFDL